MFDKNTIFRISITYIYISSLFNAKLRMNSSEFLNAVCF